MSRVILGDIAISQTGPFGSQLHEEDYVSEGTPIVTVEHLGDINFTHQNLPFVSEADTKRLSKYILIEGDIVFSRVGSIDRNVYVDKNHEGWMFSGRCIRVRADKNKVNPRYLSYYFKQNSFKKMMMNLAVGATMPSLNTKIMNSIELDLLPRENQDKIANILSAIDDKIQINNQINQELEAMVKTLYDYWFVQFDFPDQNGKPYKSSGGKMVYNPELKREIPEGWGVENLFDIADVQYGYPFSTDYFNSTGEGVPVIRIRDILGNDITNYSTEEVEDKYKINVGDVLIGMDGNFHMNYWIKEDCYLNQRVVKVNSDKLPNMVLKYQIEPFIKLREKSVSRTTVGHLSDKDLKAINVILPKDKYLSSIFEKFESILENIIINQQQNQELTQLRDWLLPMLMNGQVKVE